MIKIISLIILMFVFRFYASEAECKDPDKFSIKSYRQVNLTKFNLDLAEAEKRLEGKYYMILYWIKDTFEGKKSAIEVARNYGKAAQKNWRFSFNSRFGK